MFSSQRAKYQSQMLNSRYHNSEMRIGRWVFLRIGWGSMKSRLAPLERRVLEKVLPKVVPRATYFRNTLLRPVNERNAPAEYIQNTYLFMTQGGKECLKEWAFHFPKHYDLSEGKIPLCNVPSRFIILPFMHRIMVTHTPLQFLCPWFQGYNTLTAGPSTIARNLASFC